MIFQTTPSQTVGPYFAIGLPWDGGPLVVPADAPGAIRIKGVVYDGAGIPVPDALIETWQADPEGRFSDLHGYGEQSQLAGFRGFGRCGHEDGDGSFEIVTVKPGRVFDPTHPATRHPPAQPGTRSRRRISTCRCSRAGC